MSRVPASVLFVCSENALRSPMAEGMVKAFFGDRVYVDSIGVRDGELDPMASAVMQEIGIDISGHRPKRLDDLLDTSFDAIVALSAEAHQEALDRMRNEAVDVVFWPIGDPSVVDGNRDVRLAAYREVRDTLRALIEEMFREPHDAP
ncbi:MAG: arsenate reductase ArsC [Proteobacteria bacterium]|nr:arsenate reductase ArsC [Pseudomonadota bacterium]